MDEIDEKAMDMAARLAYARLCKEMGVEAKNGYICKHRDESQIHYHFTVLAYDFTKHEVIRKSIDRKKLSKMQDITGDTFSPLGFSRGEKKFDKLDKVAFEKFSSAYADLNADDKKACFESANVKHKNAKQRLQEQKGDINKNDSFIAYQSNQVSKLNTMIMQKADKLENGYPDYFQLKDTVKRQSAQLEALQEVVRPSFELAIENSIPKEQFEQLSGTFEATVQYTGALKVTLNKVAERSVLSQIVGDSNKSFAEKELETNLKKAKKAKLENLFKFVPSLNVADVKNMLTVKTYNAKDYVLNIFKKADSTANDVLHKEQQREKELEDRKASEKRVEENLRFRKETEQRALRAKIDAKQEIVIEDTTKPIMNQNKGISEQSRAIKGVSVSSDRGDR